MLTTVPVLAMQMVVEIFKAKHLIATVRARDHSLRTLLTLVLVSILGEQTSNATGKVARNNAEGAQMQLMHAPPIDWCHSWTSTSPATLLKTHLVHVLLHVLKPHDSTALVLAGNQTLLTDVFHMAGQFFDF
jgi:hypothetical protein